MEEPRQRRRIGNRTHLRGTAGCQVSPYVQLQVKNGPKDGDQRDIRDLRVATSSIGMCWTTQFECPRRTSSAAVPILAEPAWLDSAAVGSLPVDGDNRRREKVPIRPRCCVTPIWRSSSLTSLTTRKMFFGISRTSGLSFSVTYYENNRPRQFYPDFIVAGGEMTMVPRQCGWRRQRAKCERMYP